MKVRNPTVREQKTKRTKDYSSEDINNRSKETYITETQKRERRKEGLKEK